MTQPWMIAPGAEPIVRLWGDECVVHHALSNDTYRLTAAAARILIELAGAPPDGASVTAGTVALEDAEALEVLQVLTRLALVARC